MNGPQSATGGGLPSRPWEDFQPRTAEDLVTPQRAQGQVHGSEFWWIPGVVLATASDRAQADLAIADLRQALDQPGTALGILLLVGGVNVSPEMTAQLAKRRIRVQPADPRSVIVKDVRRHGGAAAAALQAGKTYLQRFGGGLGELDADVVRSLRPAR